MKILDRYVLRSFVFNYVVSLVVLIGLFVVLDMVFNFDELVEVRGAGAIAGASVSSFDIIFAIAEYYFYQVFLIFVHLSGIIPVVAAAFTLIRLTRFNELSAMLSAGIPLLRVALPVILAGVVLNIVLLPIDQELLIPRMIPKLTRQHDQLLSASSKSFPIQAMQDDRNGLLLAGRYTPPGPKDPAVMRVVDIIERDENLEPVAHITAEKATWEPRLKHWALHNGLRVAGLAPQASRSREPERVETYGSNITPDEIALYRSGDFVSLLSTARINELLSRRQSYGAVNLLRVKHSRIAQPLLNVITLLLAIPCLMSREPGKLKVLMLKCLVLVGLCIACAFLTYQIAAHPPAGPQWTDRWPLIMAALPVLIFGPVAVFLLERLSTKGT
jgi:lipopolysaccharide export LptBFGC system permease protein LptF